MATCRGAGQLVRTFSTSASKQKLVNVPLKLYGVAGRYATALYSAASKEKQLDAVEKEMKAFQSLIAKDTKLAAFLADPSYQRRAKQSAMAQVIKGQKYSNVTSNFFVTLAENARLTQTSNILTAFNQIMSAHRGELSCVVTTAKALDAGDEKELKAALQGFVKQGQSLNMTMEIDPAIRGGMIVNFGDKFIDMSTATKIKKYTDAMQKSI